MIDRSRRAVALTLALSTTAALAGANADRITPTWPDRIEWAEDGPAAREHPSVMVFGERVVVFGGSGYAPQGAPLADAWAFDIGEHTWTSLALDGDVPPAAGSRRVAMQPGADHAYLFGGYAANFETNNDLFRAHIDGDTLRFERLDQTNPPPARALHAFGLDTKSGTLIVTCGVSRTGFFGDTWLGSIQPDGAVHWKELTTDTHPTPRFGGAFAFDTDSGELILLSGQTPGTAESPMPMSDELWLLESRADPPTWKRVELADPPAGRRNPVFAFDDESDTLAVWCGTADARTNIPGLITIRRDTDGTWKLAQHTDENATPRRSSGTGFADPTSDLIYLGLGNSAEGQFTDWLTLDLTPQND